MFTFLFVSQYVYMYYAPGPQDYIATANNVRVSPIMYAWKKKSNDF